MDVAKLFNLGYRWEENVRSLQRRVFGDYGEWTKGVTKVSARIINAGGRKEYLIEREERYDPTSCSLNLIREKRISISFLFLRNNVSSTERLFLREKRKKKKNSLKNGNIHIHAEVIFETRGKESLESKRGRVINIERSRRRGALSVHVETHLSLCLFKEEKAGILEESPTPFEPQLLPGRWIQREREQ